MSSLGEFAQEDAAQEDVKAALNKALRQLDSEKKKKADLVEAVYQAAHDAALGLDYKAVAKPKKDTRKAGAEVAIAVASDWQLAKLTPDYDSDVCAERLAKFGDKLEELADIQRADHPVKEARLYLLGDLVEGEMIFPGQSHRIDSSLFRQVMTDGPKILGDLLRRMARTFEKVHVVGVIGNHGSLGGRARHEYHPESNADAMMYETTRIMLSAEERITWASNVTPGERHWYATDKVGDKTFFMFHGDQIKGGFAGYPWYGLGKKLLGWRALPSIPDFDYSLSGHFHTPMRLYLNGITHWGNGSTESNNTYAAEGLAASGEPQQWLLFCHPKHGVTAEYSVRL